MPERLLAPPAGFEPATVGLEDLPRTTTGPRATCIFSRRFSCSETTARWVGADSHLVPRKRPKGLIFAEPRPCRARRDKSKVVHRPRPKPISKLFNADGFVPYVEVFKIPFWERTPIRLRFPDLESYRRFGSASIYEAQQHRRPLSDSHSPSGSNVRE